MAIDGRLYLLGSFRFERAGALVRLPTRKVEALLAYLALHPGEHAREKLAGLFWGETGDAQARASLRGALPALRAQLGEALQTSTQSVALAAGALWVDALAFRAQADAFLHTALAQPGAVDIDLYRGDLLDGFYDEWIGPEREAWRAQHLDVLLRLAQRARAGGEYRQALDWAGRLLALEPAAEAAHREAIASHLALGDRDAARRQYALCVRALRDELAAEPEPATVALGRQLESTERAAPPAGNLPTPLTSFIGRERELASVRAWLAPGGPRLLTITGPGGAGKTRLAVRAAAEAAPAYADGAWWVELAALADPSLVAPAAAQALGAPVEAGETAEAALLRHLRPRQALLVLDNCEHLTLACAQLAAALLLGCPGLRVLCTSRQSLGLDGETIWPAPPLSMEETETASPSEAARLFAARAASARPGFAITPENSALITEICRRLDGMPLAIELAAARTRVLALPQIAARLADRFNLLTGGSRAALPRQQTLRAAMDWSHDLLSPAERRLFRRLAVFAGGFSLEAAETMDAVLPARLPDFGPTAATLDTLTRLVEQSLVQADQGRFRLLETIRQYAADQLWLAGEEAAANDRHLLWFKRLAEARAQAPDLAQVYDALELEHDNFRAALRWAAEADPDTEADRMELGLRLCTALWQFWGTRGYMAEGRQRLEALLALTAQTAGPVHAEALLAAGGLAIRQGDFAGARPRFEASLIAYTELDDAAGIAAAQLYLGWTANAFGEYEQARAHYTASLALRRQLGAGHALEVADTLANLGMLAFFQSQPGEAAPLLAESAALARDQADARRTAFAIYLLGNALAEQGDFDTARRQLVEAQRLVQGLNDRLLAAYLLESFACLDVLANRELARAASLLGAAEAERERIHSPLPPQWRAYCARLSALAAVRIGEAVWQAAWAAGRGWSAERAAEQALL